MRRMCPGVTVFIAALFAFAARASASGAIDLGGRTAVTANFSATVQKPGESAGVDVRNTIITLGTSFTRTTADARWEYGAGFTVVAFVAETDSPDQNDTITTATYTPSLQVRINSDLLGPEKNFLVYAGFIAGVTIIDFEFLDDEVGVFGPKFGAEYYFSSSLALQLQNDLLFDTEKGITNNLSFGVKLLF